MIRNTAAVILAAGKSTRMKSALPKAVHPVCGKPMTLHVIDACKKAGVENITVVVGHEAEKVKNTLGNTVSYAIQTEQLGTGHAALQAMPHISDTIDTILVLPGDAPLITSDSIRKLIEFHNNESNAISLLTAIVDDAKSYGRIIRDSSGNVEKILEAKDASPDELEIREINASIYCFRADFLSNSLTKIRPENAQKEYYLTDVIGIARESGEKVGAVIVDDAKELLGINNRVELAEASAIMKTKIMNELMMSGVSIIDPTTTYIECDVEIGRDTVVMPSTIIERGCKIGSGLKIGPFAHLAGTQIADASVEERGNE